MWGSTCACSARQPVSAAAAEESRAWTLRKNRQQWRALGHVPSVTSGVWGLLSARRQLSVLAAAAVRARGR